MQTTMESPLTMSKLESVNVENIDESQLYTVRLEFRSKGGGLTVMPNVEYSHHFPDEYEGPWPAGYLAMRDILIMLSMEMSILPNTELDNLPGDPDEAAEQAIGLAQRLSLPDTEIQ